MPNLQLEGRVDDEDDLKQRLAYNLDLANMEIRRLKDELESEKLNSKQLQLQVDSMLAPLREVLSPLRNAVNRIYDRLEDISPSAPPGAENHAIPRAWRSWMDKLPGLPAKFIDALLQHGELTAAQLRIHGQCGNQTVYDTISKMSKLGLIDKTGNGRYSLKKL